MEKGMQVAFGLGEEDEGAERKRVFPQKALGEEAKRERRDKGEDKEEPEDNKGKWPAVSSVPMVFKSQVSRGESSLKGNVILP